MTNVEKIMIQMQKKRVMTIARMEIMFKKDFSHLVDCKDFDEQISMVEIMFQFSAVYQLDPVGYFSDGLATASKIALYAEKHEEVFSGVKSIKVSSEAVVFTCLKDNIEVKNTKLGVDKAVPMIRINAFFSINALTFNLRS